MLLKFFKFSEEQKNRLSKNITSQLSLNAVQTIAQIFFPPLMILIWGVDTFGLILFLLAIPLSLAFLNINFTIAARQEMSIAHSTGNMENLNDTYMSTIILQLFGYFLFSIAVIIYVIFFDYDLKIFENFDIGEIKIFLIFIFLSFYLTFFVDILSIGIGYKGKFHYSTNIFSIYEVLWRISFIIVGLVSSSLILASVMFFVVNLIRSFLHFYLFKKYNYHLAFSLNKASKKTIKKIFNLSGSIYLESLSELIKSSVLVIVLGIFFNLSTITFIVTARTLFYFFPIRIINIFAQSIQYEYANLYARNKLYDLKSIHKKQILFTLLIICLFVLFSLFLGPYIYGLWLQNKFEINLILLSLIILDASFTIINYNAISTLKAINDYFQISLFQFLSTLIVLIISMILFMKNFNFQAWFVLSPLATLTLTFFSILKLKKFYHHKNTIN